MNAVEAQIKELEDAVDQALEEGRDDHAEEFNMQLENLHRELMN